MDGRMHVYLETERVILRRFTEEVVDHLVELDSDPEVMWFLTGGKPAPREVVQNEALPRFLRDYERSDRFGRWAAIDKPTGAFLGRFIFRLRDEAHPEEAWHGYRLRRSAWGKGYATEVVCALIQKGFTELGVERVTTRAARSNYASRRVMEKAGMTLVRTFRFEDPSLCVLPGSDEESVDYVLTRVDWENAAE